jgi:nicotinate-nucleotide adenylyltransferase
VKNYPIYVYRRSGHDINPADNLNADTIILDAPLLQISATYIRETIKRGKSIRYLVPEKVLEEIAQNGYYK